MSDGYTPTAREIADAKRVWKGIGALLFAGWLIWCVVATVNTYGILGVIALVLLLKR